MFDNIGGSNRGDPRKSEPIKDNQNLLLFDMENDATENINLAIQKPGVVEKLKQSLADIIKSGRSTKGKKQQNDPLPEGQKWPHINVVTKYL